MLLRVVLAIACSVLAIKYAQLKGSRDRGDSHGSQEPRRPRNKKRIHRAHAAQKEEEEKINPRGIISPVSSTQSLQDVDQILLPEFVELCHEPVELPSDFENSTVDKLSLQSHQTSDGSSEFEQLKAIVVELQQREISVQTQLLEYYGLKEQEEKYVEIERQLKLKDREIEQLKEKICYLETQMAVLCEELREKDTIEKELEMARAKIKELHWSAQNDASETKAQLLFLKQQVSNLQEREQTLRELEVEVVGLRRMCKELQFQKRELTVKLDAAESKINELSSINEREIASQVQVQVAHLRQENEDLAKQVEGLQLSRFSEVEEVVYLRWVNACLRYELRNYKASPGKMTALDLGKTLSPKSQENAKRLMMEYAAPDLMGKSKDYSEQDYDSISSFASTSSELDMDDSSFDSHSARQPSSRKSGLIKKIKKWGKGKEDMRHMPSTSFSSDLKYSPTRMDSPKVGAKGTLASLLRRHRSDSLAISTSGTNLDDVGRHSMSDSNESLEVKPPIKQISSTDFNECGNTSVCDSFDLISKSVADVLGDKCHASKGRHKLALERERAIKQKAERARAEKFAGKAHPESCLPIKLGKSVLGSTDINAVHHGGADTMSMTTETNSEHNITVSKNRLSEIENRSPRVPRSPPKSSIKHTSQNSSIAGPLPPKGNADPPPPPPPPPPLPGIARSQGLHKERMKRAPELVEFYQSLMRREAKKDSAMRHSDSKVSEVHNSLIGEFENQSTFLQAVKADVETQGDFVLTLAMEVRNALYTEMEDIVKFVSWLDEELSFLVDERAVLKHFDWPESKTDALREAAFEYEDLKKLEVEISFFEDDPKMPCESALKRMLSLLEKVEENVYGLLRTRDMAVGRYGEFGIPTEWMLDSGLVGKIKLGTVQLARKYMKRVVSELDSPSTASASKEAQEAQSEYLLLQGVRFAFRVHQFAGGFDTESMQTFEELRDRAHAHIVHHPTT